MKFLVFILISFVRAQHQIELQFIGDSLSEIEVTNKDLCVTKYCLLDSSYLFSAATQNKSVRPCDDFKEFSVGTFAKYQSVSGRDRSVGFLSDLEKIYHERLRKVLTAPLNERDTRITKGIKKTFAKCVSSRFITTNGLDEIRNYARSVGLSFYPESDFTNFNLTKYIEQQPFRALNILFSIGLFRNDNESENLELRSINPENFEQQLSSYNDMLYDMNQVYLNASYSDEYKKEFNEIVNRQIEFYHQLEKFKLTVSEDEAESLTIEELNKLTSQSLKINWLTTINNQLITKVESDELIYVRNPQRIAKLAELLSSLDQKKVADYLVYGFLYEQSDKFIVYTTDEYTKSFHSAKRSRERWYQCLPNFYILMEPALDFLYLQTFRDQEIEDSITKFAYETIEFAIKKFKKANRYGEKVLRDVIERLRSIKFELGYSNFVDLEEIYGDIEFGDDVNYAAVTDQFLLKYFKIFRETKRSKIRKLIELSPSGDHEFKYHPEENVMFVASKYLIYPFYHNQRPRFFNSATVSSFIFRSLYQGFKSYLKKKHNVDDFEIFGDVMQVTYDSCKDWLESGGVELNLGANRLTNQQLYWVAIARTVFRKYQFTDKEFSSNYDRFNEIFAKQQGFVEAFNCQSSN